MAINFYTRYALALLWLLIMSVVGVLLVPFLFWNKNFNAIVAHFGGFGLTRILGIRIRWTGQAPIEADQPCVYICNHQDNLDVFIFGSIFPKNTVVIGKKEIGWIPFFNLFYVAAGNILLDRKNRMRAISGIRDAGRRIRDFGRSVMIFPEGTRNRGGVGLLPFKKGAFHLAMAAQLPLVPLVASSLAPLVDYRRKKITPGVITITRLDPIPTAGLTDADLPKLMSLAHERMLAALNSQLS